MQPLVSIIIPTYNRAHLIGETLNSIITQTHKNWECIVVDDGSADYTQELIKFYCEKDTRIKYYHRPQDRPIGANACRNYGLELSKGEFVNWFDSDDIMTKEKLATQLEVLKKDISLHFCTCLYGLYDENFQLISRMPFKTSNLLEDYIIGKAFFNFQTSLFRRDTLVEKPLRENLFKAQEMDFFFRYLQQKNLNYKLINEEFVKVRFHEMNITNSFRRGNKKAINSEMKVRLEGLKILKNKSSEKSLGVALNNYMMFLKVIFIQKKLGLYYRYLYALIKILPFNKYLKVFKLMCIGCVYFFTGKGLYYFCNESVFK